MLLQKLFKHWVHEFFILSEYSLFFLFRIYRSVWLKNKTILLHKRVYWNYPIRGIQEFAKVLKHLRSAVGIPHKTTIFMFWYLISPFKNMKFLSFDFFSLIQLWIFFFFLYHIVLFPLCWLPFLKVVELLTLD